MGLQPMKSSWTGEWGEDGEYKLGVEAQGRVLRGEILKDEGA